MQRKINCKYNDEGAWCTNKNIKRSLFGHGCTKFKINNIIFNYNDTIGVDNWEGYDIAQDIRDEA